jgi:serralysin
MDTLDGGLGWDKLVGGTEADVFIYRSAKDSLLEVPGQYEHGNGILVSDLIIYFETGLDTLDLREVDADVLAEGDQAFTIVNEFTGSRAGELVLTDPVASGDGDETSMLLADLDGDKLADFAIEFYGDLPQGVGALITEFDILL